MLLGDGREYGPREAADFALGAFAALLVHDEQHVPRLDFLLLEQFPHRGDAAGRNAGLEQGAFPFGGDRGRGQQRFAGHGGEAEADLFHPPAFAPHEVVLKGQVGLGQLQLGPVQDAQLKQRELLVLAFQVQQVLEVVYPHRAGPKAAVLLQQPVNPVGVRALELQQLHELGLGEVALVELQQVLPNAVVEAHHQGPLLAAVIGVGHQGSVGKTRGFLDRLVGPLFLAGPLDVEHPGSEQRAHVFELLVIVAAGAAARQGDDFRDGDAHFAELGVVALNAGKHGHEQAHLQGGEREPGVHQIVALDHQLAPYFWFWGREKCGLHGPKKRGQKGGLWIKLLQEKSL